MASATTRAGRGTVHDRKLNKEPVDLNKGLDTIVHRWREWPDDDTRQTGRQRIATVKTMVYDLVRTFCITHGEERLFDALRDLGFTAPRASGLRNNPFYFVLSVLNRKGVNYSTSERQRIARLLADARSRNVDPEELNAFIDDRTKGVAGFRFPKDPDQKSHRRRFLVSVAQRKKI